jgi:putative Holliday junction resolvase
MMMTDATDHADSLNPAADAPTIRRRGRLLGVDHGDVYIGVALSDAAWLTVRRLTVLRRRTKAEDFAAIAAEVAKHEVVAVVVGLPTNPDRAEEDADGPTRAGTVRRWASRLAATLSVPTYMWEEQFSTHEAEAIAESDAGGRSPERIDDLAAVVILRAFIDANPNALPPPRPIRHSQKPVPQPPPTSEE